MFGDAECVLCATRATGRRAVAVGRGDSAAFRVGERVPTDGDSVTAVVIREDGPAGSTTRAVERDHRRRARAPGLARRSPVRSVSAGAYGARWASDTTPSTFPPETEIAHRAVHRPGGDGHRQRRRASGGGAARRRSRRRCDGSRRWSPKAPRPPRSSTRWPRRWRGCSAPTRRALSLRAGREHHRGRRSRVRGGAGAARLAVSQRGQERRSDGPAHGAACPDRNT